MSIHPTALLKSLPEPLPEGDVLLWHGAPQWRSLARRAFHIRKIAVYFVLLLALRAVLGAFGLAPMSLAGAGWLALFGVAAIAIAAAMAWLYCRTTTYLITNRRVVMRFGAALPITLNLPFGSVASAAVSVHHDGTADIPVQLGGSGRISYLHLWPHARPWRLSRPEPMLRSVPEGARVARLLADAVRAFAATAAGPEVLPPAIAPATARSEPGRQGPESFAPAAA